MAKLETKPHDEPVPEGEDWVEGGGQLIYAMGYTPGGAPYGITEAEFREINEQYAPKAGWVIAKNVLRHTFGDKAEIGWVRFLGEGLYYRAYTAEVGPPEKLLVVRLPKTERLSESREMGQREVRVLKYLDTLDLPIRLPSVIATVNRDSPVSTGLPSTGSETNFSGPPGRKCSVNPNFQDNLSFGTALVQRFVKGFPLEMRAPRNPLARPWNIIAKVAALCHRVDPGPLEGVIPWHLTRRAHALAVLKVFEDIDLPETKLAVAWAFKNIPPEEPSRFIHGDLLGQNIQMSLDGDVCGILDWGCAAVGDPAYDLAIVSQGQRKPFQIENGLAKLLEAYTALSDVKLTYANVRLYELCLIAGLYKQDVQQFGLNSSSAENARASLRGFIKKRLNCTS